MSDYVKNIMQKQKKYYLVSISLCLVSFCSGQTAAELKLWADSQYSAGNYMSAAREYERIRYFSENTKERDELARKIADSYYGSGNYSRAAELYEGVIFLTENDSIRNAARLLKIRCYIHTGNYPFALAELCSLNDSIAEPWKSEYEFYQGITQFGLGNYPASENCFISCLPEKDSGSVSEINELFRKTKRLKHLNPKTAQLMSLLLPGAGQCYSGNVRRGLNSLVLLGALTLLFYNVATEYSVFDAVISVFPWWER